jgi:CheY-like chemotaxis protein/anti-sigma regulatory factor (Ser/Thr protein kinase)
MIRILIVEDDRVGSRILARALEAKGLSVATAADGVEGLQLLRTGEFQLALIDIWMPRLSGLELLAHMRAEGIATKAIVMTSDGTPETLLRAVREHAYRYLGKPIDPKTAVEAVTEALSASSTPPIEVLSAKSHWVELLVPCDLTTAERIHDFMARLHAELPDEVRESVGMVFREMLMNAVEWGGKLDPNRKVRISYLRARRMVLYRIADPGPGFNFEELQHAAVTYAPGDFTHAAVREQKGIRPGGFGILMARQMVDEFLYNEVHNEVVFVKYLD